MKILIACEESQTVCKAFRALGHEAYSCDIIDCSGGHPEWHIKADVLTVLDRGWDMMIAHPPCTYLSVSGLHWNKRRPERAAKTELALDFVKALMGAPIDKIAVENPVSCISSRIRKPDQMIQPSQFGEDASKATCLWLKNVPELEIDPRNFFPPRYVCKCGGIFGYDLGKYGCPSCNGESGAALQRWGNQTNSGQNVLPPSKGRAKLRSKTYQGIADAMAEQWG